MDVQTSVTRTSQNITANTVTINDRESSLETTNILPGQEVDEHTSVLPNDRDFPGGRQNLTTQSPNTATIDDCESPLETPNISPAQRKQQQYL